MLATLISGGLFGAVGSVVKGVLGFFEKRDERKHELAMLEANKQYMLAEAQANIRITEAKVQGEVDLEEMKAFAVSQAAADTDMTKTSWINNLLETKVTSNWAWVWAWFPKTIGTILVSMMALIDCIRRLMRPALTIYVMVAATWVTKMVWDIVTAGGSDALTNAQAAALLAQAIDFIFFMASSGFGWWFSDRTINKQLFKKYGNDNV